MDRATACLTLLLALAATALPAAAQGAGAEGSAGIAPPALERIERSLREIAEALREIQVDQRTLLALRRIEIAEARLAPLSAELHRARDDVRASQDEIAQLNAVAESFRDQVAAALRSGADPRDSAAHVELEQIEKMVDLEKERLETARRRVIEAEDDLARDRERIKLLEEQLEERLAD